MRTSKCCLRMDALLRKLAREEFAKAPQPERRDKQLAEVKIASERVASNFSRPELRRLKLRDEPRLERKRP
jgi:hypothetical protein